MVGKRRHGKQGVAFALSIDASGLTPGLARGASASRPIREEGVESGRQDHGQELSHSWQGRTCDTGRQFSACPDGYVRVVPGWVKGDLEACKRVESNNGCDTATERLSTIAQTMNWEMGWSGLQCSDRKHERHGDFAPPFHL